MNSRRAEKAGKSRRNSQETHYIHVEQIRGGEEEGVESAGLESGAGAVQFALRLTIPPPTTTATAAECGNQTSDRTA